MDREETMKAIAPLLARPPQSGPRIAGFKAWSGPVLEGTLSSRETLGSKTTRAIWDEPRGRVAVTTTEHDSARDALLALVETLESNQLAELPRGPSDLGEISFVHPQGAPPAVFFVRANLVVAIHSIAREDVEVLPSAYRVDAALLNAR